MQINESIINHPRDHIMANTWRLIFEGRAQLPGQATSDDKDDILEQLLSEYRLIGLSLVDEQVRRQAN